MSKVDNAMQAWGRKFLGVKDDSVIDFYDSSMTDGGCETCGYGGDTGYSLEVYVQGKMYVIGHSKTYDGGFTNLLDELSKYIEEEN